MEDIIPSLRNDGVKIIPVENISDVLENALAESKKKKALVSKLKKIIK